MRRIFRPNAVALAAVGLIVMGSIPAMGQSGSRSNNPRPRPRPSTPRANAPAASPQRSTSPAYRPAPVLPRSPSAILAMEGYCPVSIRDAQKWVKGDREHKSVYDNRTYWMASEEAKQRFEADPARYVPVLSGDCVVALVNQGRRMPGDIRHATFHGGRLYLFANTKAHQAFRSDPKKYAYADLAYRGYCVVCSRNMQQFVRGKMEIAAVHEGLRYLFPSDQQRREFLSSPSKYQVSAEPAQAGRKRSSRSPARSGASSGSSSSSSSGSSSRRSAASGSGSR